ncbi:MAG TPA: hypothetical protein VIJ77_04925 [Candidatus Tumulicola sp.]
MDLLATAMALKEPEEKDWIAGAKPQTGTNLRVTADTELTSRLRGGGFVEVLQAPQRGRQPATGRPKYILKVYPNADAPAAPIAQRIARRAPIGKNKRIPWYLLVPITEAAVAEWKKQRATIAKQLDQEVDSLETQLRSTRDRMEKKRLADALQTALHADENLEGEIAKRVYTKLSTSHEPYSKYVDLIDWSARK